MSLTRRALITGLVSLPSMPAVARSGSGRISWSELPALPLAVSGHFAGVSGGALLVAGGAYFPKSLFEGGVKVWTDQVAVLEQRAPTWRTGYFLPQHLAYGATVSLPDGVVCIGGSDAREHSSDVFKLRWQNHSLVQEVLPRLPGRCAFHAAAVLDDVIYVAGGQEAPDSLARQQLLVLNLTRKSAQWGFQEPWPGPARILPALVAQAGSLYLMGGCALHRGADGKPAREYLRDAYRLTPGSGWTRLPDAPRPLTAAPAVAWGQSHVLILGGDNGELAGRVQELKDQHPGFCKDLLSFDTTTDTWQQLGTLPVGLVTTNAVRWGKQLVIPGGEDRPGHRSTRVLATPI